ncbi:endocuticle structural glycoprotein SgAbd-1-like [Homalodisca vitripennis]|uniref:endocuticle structural glycoprotein SgAbd-1-like n=1 Tax=Homalodisca vitripennis TaxID=197043 RepID=UPI001EECA631|nr:endocuticle structural glycoprotein SgAbd-1-like [Homalodisca vitripennis]
MNSWTVLLFVCGAVSAHHGQYHPVQSSLLSYSAIPQVPVQHVYPARVVPAVVPALQLPAPVYSTPQYPASTSGYVATPVSTYTPRYQAPVQVSQPVYSRQYARPAAILRQSQDGNFDGSFSYDFQTENGISAQAQGYLKNPGTVAESQVIHGQFAYTSPDGTPIATRYYADDTGFHAEGSHLPVSPQAPQAISRSLSYQKSPLVSIH